MSKITEELNIIFDNVNEWLKFAESKNAVIIGLNGAAIFSLISTFSCMFSLKGWLSTSGILVVLLLLLSTTVSLLSFIPNLKMMRLPSINSNNAPVNIIYFGSIAILEHDEFIMKVAGLMKVSMDSVSDLDRQYAKQIVNNSRIALLKYRFFTLAVWLDIIAIIALLIGVIILFVLSI